MKKIILLHTVIFCVVSMQAQKIDESVVPTNVKTTFQKTYPSIKKVKWEKEKGNYEANFKEGTIEESATFNIDGKFLESEKTISVSALPKAATEYLSKNLPGKEIKEASKIENAAGIITYEAEVNKIDYTFDANGNYLKQEADND
jgi:hypothetical protein